MKLEELTKQQIVLLTLLVAFVSSTTSAIVVVRLMEDAPVTSSPTINRVIERTVQQVIPGETKEITRTNTVVIKEEDLVVEAIEENKNSVLVVRETITDESGVEKQIVNSSAVYLIDGYVLADGRIISGPGKYFIEDNGVKIPLVFVVKDKSGFSLLKIDSSIKLSDISFVAKKLDSVSEIRVGQSAIVLSANPAVSAFTGLISSRTPFTITVEDGEQTLFDKIKMNISLAPASSGGILVTSDGGISGLVMVRENDIFAIPSKYIEEKIAEQKALAVKKIGGESLPASASTAAGAN